MDERVAIALISKPFGIKGELAVIPYGSEQDTAQLMGKNRTLHIGDTQHTVEWIRRRNHKSCLLKLHAIPNRAAAETLRGMIIKVPEKSLEQRAHNNTYYHYQLIGLQVNSSTGQPIGNLAGIINTGANDVYVVDKHGGGTLMVPAIANAVKNVDLQSRIVTVDPEACI